MTDVFEPEITVLYCGRGLTEGQYLPEGAKRQDGFKVRFVMIPCVSKVEVGYLVKLIEDGADGVTLVACPASKCQLMLGRARAENRVRYAQKLLEEAGIPADRLAFADGFDLSSGELATIAQGYAELLNGLGPNLMRN